MEEQSDVQEYSTEQSPKGKKKLKFKELSKFWKGMVIVLSVTTFVAIGAAVGYFMIYIYPLFGLMGG